MNKIKSMVCRFTGKRYVRQNDYARLIWSPPLKGDNTRAAIAYTDGLVGCLATVLYVKQKDCVIGQLAHFEPSENVKHRDCLQDFLNSAEVKAAPLLRAKLIVVAPGKYIFPGSGEIDFPESFYSSHVRALFAVVHAEIRPKMKRDETILSYGCIPYSTLPPVGKSYHYTDVTMTLDHWSSCEIRGLSLDRFIEL